MVFNYSWEVKDESNYCIRKKDSKDSKAGKEIEPTKNQTSDTHFFMWVDEKDKLNLYELHRINKILKTIKYEYYYINEVGKETKSKKQYLTKKDIDYIIKNIDNFKNQIVKIYTTPPKKIYNKSKWDKMDKIDFFNRMEEIYGNNFTDAIILINKRNEKIKILRKKKQEVKNKIKDLNKEYALFENETNNEIAKLEKIFFNKTKDIVKYKETDIRLIRTNDEFHTALGLFTNFARFYNIRIARNKRQANYRDRKKSKSGKPTRGRGRPKKDKT